LTSFVMEAFREKREKIKTKTWIPARGHTGTTIKG